MNTILENEVEVINEIGFIGRTFNGISIDKKSIVLSIDDVKVELIPNLMFGCKTKLRYTIPIFHKIEEYIGSKIRSIKQHIDLRSIIFLEVETTFSIIRIYFDCKDGHCGIHVKEY